MARGPKRGGGGGGNETDWSRYLSNAAPGAVGAGATFNLMDQAIHNALTTVSWDAGAIVGLRVWGFINTLVLGMKPPSLICMIIPSGDTIPTITTDAIAKRHENKIWWVALTESDAGSGTYQYMVHLSTARRFNAGDRLVIQLYNNDAAAFLAGSTSTTLVDCYIRED